jgi:hypothetical protein
MQICPTCGKALRCHACICAKGGGKRSIKQTLVRLEAVKKAIAKRWPADRKKAPESA